MKTRSRMVWPGLFLMASAAAHAGEVAGLKSFTSGTPALASEVNGNFTAVKSAVDDNHARLATQEGVNAAARLTALENIDMGSRLTALEAQINPPPAPAAAAARVTNVKGTRP